MRNPILFITIFSLSLLSYSPADAESRGDTGSIQTPETLCRCASNKSTPKGGIQTLAEFDAKFGAGFERRDELELAWRVYKAVNQCDAVVVLGRLPDTQSFENKAGFCVLRTLVGWTIRVNKAFVRAATDRGARIQLVSEMPTEALGRNDNIDMIGPEDRESNWIVIYNNEIQWVLATGNYNLANDRDKKITPNNPAYLQPDIKQAKKGDWVLVSATVSPEDPNVTWKDHAWSYTAQSTSAHYSIYNGDFKVDYSWNPPPFSFGLNGFQVSFGFSGTVVGNQAISAVIGVSTSGLTSDTPDDQEHRTASAAGTGSISAQKSVNFKPMPSASDIVVTIGMGWSVSYTYKYHRL